MARALLQFDLDADGVLSGFEVSRAAQQAGVAGEDIPRLLQHLGIGPSGFRGVQSSDVFSSKC